MPGDERSLTASSTRLSGSQPREFVLLLSTGRSTLARLEPEVTVRQVDSVCSDRPSMMSCGFPPTMQTEKEPCRARAHSVFFSLHDNSPGRDPGADRCLQEVPAAPPRACSTSTPARSTPTSTARSMTSTSTSQHLPLPLRLQGFPRRLPVCPRPPRLHPRKQAQLAARPSVRCGCRVEVKATTERARFVVDLLQAFGEAPKGRKVEPQNHTITRMNTEKSEDNGAPAQR